MKDLDKKMLTAAVFSDMSKAFHSVNHEMLSFFKHSTSSGFVASNSTPSEPLRMTCAVPQEVFQPYCSSMSTQTIFPLRRKGAHHTLM